MAKKTVNPEAVEIDEEVSNDEFLPATGNESSIVHHDAVGVGEVAGEVDPTQFNMPRLKIVHGTSNAADKFELGSLQLDDEILVAKRGDVATFIITSAIVYWKEWVEFGTGVMPREFKTEAEAIQAGLRTRPDFNSSPPVYSNCSQALDVNILIRKPEELDEHPVFCVDLPDGHSYAPARFTFEKGVFRKTGSEILKILALAGRKGEPTTRLLWDMSVTSYKSKQTGNNVLTPKVSPAGRNEDEVLTTINELLG